MYFSMLEAPSPRNYAWSYIGDLLADECWHLPSSGTWAVGMNTSNANSVLINSRCPFFVGFRESLVTGALVRIDTQGRANGV